MDSKAQYTSTKFYNYLPNNSGKFNVQLSEVTTPTDHSYKIRQYILETSKMQSGKRSSSSPKITPPIPTPPPNTPSASPLSCVPITSVLLAPSRTSSVAISATPSSSSSVPPTPSGSPSVSPSSVPPIKVPMSGTQSPTSNTEKPAKSGVASNSLPRTPVPSQTVPAPPAANSRPTNVLPSAAVPPISSAKQHSLTPNSSCKSTVTPTSNSPSPRSPVTQPIQSNGSVKPPVTTNLNNSSTSPSNSCKPQANPKSVEPSSTVLYSGTPITCVTLDPFPFTPKSLSLSAEEMKVFKKLINEIRQTACLLDSEALWSVVWDVCSREYFLDWDSAKKQAGGYEIFNYLNTCYPVAFQYNRNFDQVVIPPKSTKNEPPKSTKNEPPKQSVQHNPITRNTIQEAQHQLKQVIPYFKECELIEEIVNGLSSLAPWGLVWEIYCSTMGGNSSECQQVLEAIQKYRPHLIGSKLLVEVDTKHLKRKQEVEPEPMSKKIKLPEYLDLNEVPEDDLEESMFNEMQSTQPDT